MSFITKRHIPRRTFLKGTGVTLALPLLDAMVPASTALAQTVAGQTKSRFVGVFFPHGMGPGHWEPEVEGALPDKMPYILESLARAEGSRPSSSTVSGRSRRSRPRARRVQITGLPPRSSRPSSRGRRQAPTRQWAARRSISSSRRRSVRRHCCRRCSSPARIPIRARATAAKVTAARTPTRSRGWSCRRRKTKRCREPVRSRWS